MRRLNPDDFFAAVDDARERKYGPIDASTRYVDGVLGTSHTFFKCRECAGTLTERDVQLNLTLCSKCRATRGKNNGRRECKNCGAPEGMSTPTTRIGKVYLCKKCRKPSVPWYLEWRQGRC